MCSTALKIAPASPYTEQIHTLLMKFSTDGFFGSQMHWETQENHLSIALIAPFRSDMSRFFFEMVSRWTLPGRQVDVTLFFATRYESYFLCEMILNLDEEALSQALNNLPFLEEEILLGASSLYHASRLLEMRGLSLDAKSGLIQERIARLVKRHPKIFDYDLFSEMQHFLIASKDSFRAMRDTPHLARVIWMLYRLRKTLTKRLEEAPGKRHLTFKIKPAFLQTPFGSKEVLSVFIGLNLLKEHELFEERHLLLALMRFIPNLRLISESSFQREEREIHTRFFYLEVEKSDGSRFTSQELRILSQKAPEEIVQRIEQLVPPIFMPRNEEEVLRNILTLSHQLKYTRDIPQISVAFDEQTSSQLSFTVILVRLLHPESLPIKELFEGSDFSPTIDRVKIVGHLRRKYPKEAAVLRVRLPSSQFLREDFSVDLFEARLKVVKAIEEVLGEVRDYNGGMISKQSENLRHLKKILGGKDSLLMQNFFHSIFPVSLSATLDPQLLKELFNSLLEAMQRPEKQLTLSKDSQGKLFVVVKGEASSKGELFTRLEALQIPSSELLSAQLQVLDSFYVGFIYLTTSEQAQKAFLEAAGQ